MKQFSIPFSYRSPLISSIKERRKSADKLKKDFSPTRLEFGALTLLLARHFGFCYGVENAIEIAFRTVDEHPEKRIFLLSEMIHNPFVNMDLLERGVRFLQDTAGRPLFPFEELQADDIVIIPAFGTTLDMEKQLTDKGIQLERYNTTCPFVEKVWNRSEQIARNGFTVIVHGKPSHEETRATFSHAAAHTPTLVINDMAEAEQLGAFIRGERPLSAFNSEFAGRTSPGFDPERDLRRIGVVNQTTMLATDTQAIADYLKQCMAAAYGSEGLKEHFADTRDTLCYATSDNQSAVLGLMEHEADLALVIGGYNSSNTSHLVELCETKLPTYHIDGPDRLLSADTISHYLFREHRQTETRGYLPENRPLTVLMTSGASCPDAMVEAVIRKLAGMLMPPDTVADRIQSFTEAHS